MTGTAIKIEGLACMFYCLVCAGSALSRNLPDLPDMTTDNSRQTDTVEDPTPGQVPSTVYVVDQAASDAADTNPGTERLPFKTVQRAADAARPGDTVYVMAGKYDERITVKGGGTKGLPVAFRARPLRSVTVAGFDLEASYVHVEGFEITADKPVTAVQLHGSHCEILDNYIHHMMVAVSGTVGQPSADGNTRDYAEVAHNRIAYNEVYHCEYGFILGGENWLVENNEVRRLFMYAPGKKYDDCDYTRFFGKGCIQRYNYYHGTDTQESRVAHVDCIQTFTNNGEIAQDLLFEYNTCFDWGQGCMVESAPHVGSVRNWTFRHNIYSARLPTYRGAWGLNIIQTSDVMIENNTFAGITWFGVGLRGQESTHGQIRNNIICDVRTAVEDRMDFTPANPVIEYNLTFKTRPPTAETNINAQDPLFEDPQHRNFRLKKGSPAIGAGKQGGTIGALEYPNVYYVDSRHPAAADEPAWGYPAVPLASLAQACAIARPNETIVLREGVYREVLAPKNHGVTVRAMTGETVTISGADLFQGWQRAGDGRWSAPLAAEPKQVLRDGQPWREFRYDRAAGRITVTSGGDPRLHVFETVVRAQAIDLADRQDIKIERIHIANVLQTSAGWVKYENNPVLGGDLGTCFDVALLKENESYRMWFSWRPRKSVALVESADGINWSRPRIVLGPKPDSGWEDDINRPTVVRQNGTYHMWYTGQARGRSWIGYATSPDGVTWKRIADKPVLSSERPWEDVAVMCPHVLWDDQEAVFRMWYSAGQQYEPNAIGYATSPDGLHWEKLPANPIFTARADSPWEQHKVTACQIIPGGNDYLMFYIGFRDEHHAQIGLARSRDGISGWQRHRANPIISPGGDTWDGDACYKPFALYDDKDERWLLWYNGRRGSTEQIGLAIHHGRDLGF